MRNSFPGWLVFWSLVSIVQFGNAQVENHVAQACESANPRMVKVFGASAGRVEGYATGFVVSNDGLILTTQGVFLDGAQVRVLTADGQEYQASVIRRDRQRQLALLSVMRNRRSCDRGHIEQAAGCNRWCDDVRAVAHTHEDRTDFEATTLHFQYVAHT